MNIAATATQERYKRLRKIRESLAEKGYRLTDQRVLILDAFLRHEDLKDGNRNGCEQREHLSAEDLAIQLRQEGQQVSRSTVYRTLAILEKLGLVSKLDLGDGQSRYEFVQTPKHHHLICIKCGKAIDVSGKKIEAYTGKVSALVDVLNEDFDFDVQSHRLEFWGICSECRKAERVN
jgi:Fur family ferric uptake transcriptional regulator